MRKSSVPPVAGMSSRRQRPILTRRKDAFVSVKVKSTVSCAQLASTDDVSNRAIHKSLRYLGRDPGKNFVNANMTARMSKQTQKAKSRQSVKEWVAFVLFLAATFLLVTLPQSGLLQWLCLGAFIPFYGWAIVAMTEAEDAKL